MPRSINVNTPRMQNFIDVCRKAQNIEEVCESMGLRLTSARTFMTRVRRAGVDLPKLPSTNPKRTRAASPTSIFAGALSHRMQELGINDQALSESVGVSAHVIGQWRRGRHQPAIGHLPFLALALGVSVDYLVHGADRGQVYQNATTSAPAESTEKSV